MNDFLSETDKWLHHPLFTIGHSEVTVFGITGLVILLVLVLISEKLFRRFVLRRVLGRTQLDESVRYGVERIAGYVFILLGIYVTLQVVGIDLTSLAVVAGAVGVGLGFGLQNIFSNFVSGIIILAERPIALGDRVEVGGVAGQVAKISLRSTTVVTNDNISIIVPNSQFISETVINWSHGDPKVQFRIPIGVAYGSDTEKLKETLLALAKENPHVLAQPGPSVDFIEFGESSLNFELGVWTHDMVRSPRRFRSDLNFAIDHKLREVGIEIPFPQRDLHVRSGLPLVVQRLPADPKPPQS
ncbi:MAG: mechanosensitive ion channel [Cephaloticoccus sp.]|nr:mechanosensitive ion channel [Cephaloticoccus sp.]MCF7761403.1 mechanosensitive ion channel [Cephaloticoccus sp.]